MITSDVWLVVYGLSIRISNRLTAFGLGLASNPPLLCSEVEAGHVETSLLCQVRSVDLLPVPQLNVGIQDQDLGETNPMQGLRFP